MDAINNKIPDNKTTKSQENLFQKIWEGIKTIVNKAIEIAEGIFYRVAFGKAAVQDLSKLEEMVRSPLNDVDLSEIKKQEKQQKKELKQELKKIDKEVKQEFKNKERTLDIVKGEIKKPVTQNDLNLQAQFDETIENNQPFQALLKQMGFSYENNPDKPGVITLIKRNPELGKVAKWDISLFDCIKEPINFNKIYDVFYNSNSIREYDASHNNVIKYVENPNRLKVDVAILTAGLNQLLGGGAATSFNFKAYDQNMKMEITHTADNDYAKIITTDKEEFIAFQPNSPKAFVVPSIDSLNDRIYGSILAAESVRAMEEFERQEAEREYQKTIAYKMEQAEIFTNPDKDAWQEQEDKIFNHQEQIPEDTPVSRQEQQYDDIER